jgi:hypothetical protein
MKSSATLAAISPALVAALGQLRGVAKDSKNPHFKNDYASLEAVIETARPVLAEHGLAFMQGLGEYVGGAMTVSTRIIHESGEWIESDFQMPVAKSDPQGTASASTYARRYSLMGILGLPAVDDDGEAASRPTTQPPANEPRRDTGPGPVDGKDFYGCSGPGQSAHAAKAGGLHNVMDAMRQEIDSLPTTTALREWIEKNREDIAPMPRSWRSILREECDIRAKELGFNPEQKAA